MTDSNYRGLCSFQTWLQIIQMNIFSLGEPSLVDIIKLRMYEMGLNQTALAKLIGVSPSRISEYLSGKKHPTLLQGKKLSQKLNIDPAIVLGV